jgi:hypothetical protein
MDTGPEYLDDEAGAAPEDPDVDRILGDKLLFEIKDPQKYGGPSPPTIYRAARAGKVELVKNGESTRLTRATMKRLLIAGIGPVPFTYGKKRA